MKTIKKLFTLILTVALAVFTVASPVFAVTQGGNKGSITIEASTNQLERGDIEYNVYQILKLSVNEDKTAYSYTIDVDSPWLAFFTTGEGKNYFDLRNAFDGEHVVTLKENALSEDAAKRDFAKAALAYAEATEGVTAVKTVTLSTEKTSDTIEVPYGYYVVDSTLGTLCHLTSADPTETIVDKNSVPTIDKIIIDSTGKDTNGITADGKTSYAQIGDIIEYQTTVKVVKGAENYVVYDKMEDGLTFNEIKSVKNGEATVAAENYTFEKNKETYTFVLSFEDSYVKALTDAEDEVEIVITYTATLNEKAKISTESNDNNTFLKYGSNGKYTSVASTTKTYTYSFDVVKTDEEGTLLEGAEFKLYDDAGEVKVIQTNELTNTYRVAYTETEKSNAVTIKGAHATIEGLDGNTKYELEETKAPEGYNKLVARETVTMETANRPATINTVTNKYTSGGIQVINKKGTLLPETGGLGTKLFIGIGTVLALISAIVLVTNKRMAKEM